MINFFFAFYLKYLYICKVIWCLDDESILLWIWIRRCDGKGAGSGGEKFLVRNFLSIL